MISFDWRVLLPSFSFDPTMIVPEIALIVIIMGVVYFVIRFIRPS